MIFTSSDGLKIFHQSYKAKGAARADLLVVHGLGEHSGRYKLFTAKLTAAGFNLHLLDLRGHGRSEGLRGHAEKFDQFHQDLDEWQRSLRASGALDVARPRFLLGHSLGGLISLDYALSWESEFNLDLKGVGVSSPALGPRSFAVALKPFLDLGVLGVLEQLHCPNGVSPKFLSHDAQVIEDYLNDPLVHNKISIRLFREILATADRLMAKPQNFTIPALALVAEDDRIVDSSVAKKFFDRARGLKEFHLVRGAFHEVFNERKRDQTIAVLVRWMNQCLEQKISKPSVKSSSSSSANVATKKATSRSPRAKKARSIST